jgi:hypothetical protein
LRVGGTRERWQRGDAGGELDELAARRLQGVLDQTLTKHPQSIACCKEFYAQWNLCEIWSMPTAAPDSLSG